MRITFVHLGREHLGLEYLSSILKAAGHEVALAYDPGIFGSEDNVFQISFLEKLFSQRDKVIAAINSSKPDLVGFSVYTGTYPWACDIAREIKEKLGVKIVFGGIHVTLLPDLVIANDFIDFAILGEGECALPELVEALAADQGEYNIENLWYKKNGSVIKNKLRPPIADLDSLPWPDKSIFEKDVNYKDDYVIMASRGCVFSCHYCCESFYNRLYHNKFYRRRSVNSIMEELIAMKKRYDIREVMFNDALFFTDKQWLKTLLARYKKEIGVPFRCFGKLTYLDEELAELLKTSGCYCIEFGMQTLNEPLKRNILNRRETNQQALRAFKICDRLKLRYDIDHMFALPQEKEADHIFGAQFYSQLKYLNRLKCHNLIYFPQTEIINSAQKEGLLNEADIAEINQGKIGDFFHSVSLKDKDKLRVNKGFQVLYKILPLLPAAWVKCILNRKLYKKFYLIPWPLVYFLQLALALKGRDYRYFLYFKYYFLRIRRAWTR